MKKILLLMIIGMTVHQYAFSEKKLLETPKKEISHITIKPGESPRQSFDTFETVNKYKKSDIAVIAKVISIQREENTYQVLVERATKENRRLKTLENNYHKKILHLEKKINPNLRKDLKNKLIEVGSSFRAIEDELRDISKKSMKEKRKGITFMNESKDSQIQIRKKELNKQLIILTKKRSDIRKDYNVNVVKQSFITQDINDYKREISILPNFHKRPEEEYEASIKVIMEVIISYKGKNKKGHLLSFVSSKKQKFMGLRFSELSFGDSLYFLKPNELITIFYDSANNRITNSFININIEKAHETMKEIVSGKYEDWRSIETLHERRYN